MRPSNLSFCMKHLHTFLETRNLTLRDSELALTKLSTTLQKDVNDWSQPFSNSDGIAGLATDDGVVYVLDCPQLHPVSPGWLTKKTSNQAIIKVRPFPFKNLSRPEQHLTPALDESTSN